MEGVMLAALSGAVNSGPWRGHWDLWTLRSARQRDANASRQTSVESSPQGQARTTWPGRVARGRGAWSGARSRRRERTPYKLYT